MKDMIPKMPPKFAFLFWTFLKIFFCCYCVYATILKDISNKAKNKYINKSWLTETIQYTFLDKVNMWASFLSESLQCVADTID